MATKATLFIIDPQNDFCVPGGALYVTGAENDSKRLSDMIKKNRGDIYDIQVTLDSHHPIHIAHPRFWMDTNRNHPTPFTLISVEDVESGKFTPVVPALRTRALNYVKALRQNNRYELIIWPEHCLIGSLGATIEPQIFEAIYGWEAEMRIAGMTTKGSNPFTEHYSALKADVVDPSDPGTMLNDSLIETIAKASSQSIIGIAGQALSHCVASTGRDLFANLSKDDLKKCYILEDATSSVPGFEKLGRDFLDEALSLGVNITTTDKFFS